MTEILFEVPEDSHVTLVVFNCEGQKVATLIDREVPSGPHSVILDESRLANGIYFYQMTAGKYIETKKMALFKF